MLENEIFLVITVLVTFGFSVSIGIFTWFILSNYDIDPTFCAYALSYIVIAIGVSYFYFGIISGVITTVAALTPPVIWRRIEKRGEIND